MFSQRNANLGKLSKQVSALSGLSGLPGSLVAVPPGLYGRGGFLGSFCASVVEFSRYISVLSAFKRFFAIKIVIKHCSAGSIDEKKQSQTREKSKAKR